MRRNLSILATFVAFGLYGCGGGGSGSDSSGSSSLQVSIPVAIHPNAPSSTPFSVRNALKIRYETLDDYTPSLPNHYDAVVVANDNTPQNNQISNRVAALGRVLFYDTKLSFNNTVACASCHLPANGFSDTNRFSAGFLGGSTTAHAMRLGNIRYYKPGTAFWNKRSVSIEDQATDPIQNAVEMGFDATNGGIPALVQKMRTIAYYPELFKFAFGDFAITEQRIQVALAQFERSMVSTHNAWDTGYALNYNASAVDKGVGTPIPAFSVSEERGRSLFINSPANGGLGCAGCHTPPTFALAPNSLSNGLDAGETTVFKSPSLKNVARSGAFMHDGRFNTLEQVVEHYNSGVQLGTALDPKLITPTGTPRRLNLSTADKTALVDFLKTLNDDTLIADPKFLSPF